MTARKLGKAGLIQDPRQRPMEPAPYLVRGAGLYSEVSFQPVPPRVRSPREDEAALHP